MGWSRSCVVWGGAVAVAVVAGVLPVAAAAPSAAAVGGCARTTLATVAHQDDDLLFMNPDLAGDLDDGACLRIVYLTGGQAGHVGDYYSQSREDGVREAYAAMAGVPDRWTRSDLVVDGHTLVSSTLDGVPAQRGGVRLTFLRLPDGNPSGTGYSGYRSESLLKLFRGGIDSMGPIDGSPGYTREGLVSILRQLVRRERPTSIRTLDDQDTRVGYSLTDPVDHSDHIVTARLTQEAVLRARAGTPGLSGAEVTFYRGYSVSSLPANLTASEQVGKADVFGRYLRHENCRPQECPASAPLAASHESWSARRYPRARPTTTNGGLVSRMGSNTAPNTDSNTGRCLDVRGGTSGDGSVWTYACNGTLAQRWELTGSTIRSALDGRCLSAEGVPRVATCDGAASQSWVLSRDGMLRTEAGCLQQDDLLRVDALLHLSVCDEGLPEQRWAGAGRGGQQ